MSQIYQFLGYKQVCATFVQESDDSYTNPTNSILITHSIYPTLQLKEMNLILKAVIDPFLSMI